MLGLSVRFEQPLYSIKMKHGHIDSSESIRGSRRKCVATGPHRSAHNMHWAQSTPFDGRRWRGSNEERLAR